MARVIKTTFLLHRGYSEDWEKNNPVLGEGEPGYVIDKNKLKIGDGIRCWLDLPYIGGEGGNGGVYNASTHYDFPSIGSIDMIYKAEKERKIYQWNPIALRYDVLSEVEVTMQDVELIYGGNANGTA